jgi:hypothetical protein
MLRGQSEVMGWTAREEEAEMSSTVQLSRPRLVLRSGSLGHSGRLIDDESNASCLDMSNSQRIWDPGWACRVRPLASYAAGSRL